VKYRISRPLSFRDFTTTSLTVLSPRKPQSPEHPQHFRLLLGTFLRAQLPHVRTVQIHMRPGSKEMPSPVEPEFAELKVRMVRYARLVVAELGQYTMPAYTYDVPRTSYITEALVT
jgi:hypothetical protein